jgi:hypothetical protein
MGTSTGACGLLRIGLAVNTTPESLPAYGSDTLRNVGLIESDTPPPFKKKVSEVTTLNDGTLTFGGGLETQTYEATIVRNFGDTPHEDLFTDGRATLNQYRNFEIVYSDSGAEAWRFKGFVSEYAPQERVSENAFKVKLTIQVYGAITVVP